MLFIAVDVSGDPEYGNYKFMGLVIGTNKGIRSIIERLGNNKIHMSTIKNKKDQLKIIRQLNFDNKEIIAFCIRIEKDKVIKKIKEMKKNKNIGHQKIMRVYNHLLMYHLREKITLFLNKHNYSMSEVIFQCDSDCVNFVKDNNLRHTHAGDAHMLADIVAWGNNRNKEPKGVISIDLTKVIENEMIKALK